MLAMMISKNCMMAAYMRKGAHNDLIAFVDASEANASNKVRVDNLLATAIAASADTTPALPADYELMARKLSDGSLHTPLLSEIGIGKHTILHDLIGELFQFAPVIAALYSQQYQQALIYGAGRFPGHCHPRSADPLNQCNHTYYLLNCCC